MLASLKIRRLAAAPLRAASFYKIAEEIKLTEKDPQLYVSKQWGFLPRERPLTSLPSEFKKVDEILRRMPVNLPDGGKGLLAQGKLGDTVHNELPLYDVTKVDSTRLLEALIRDYAFLASAYLLEPCDLKYQKTQEYGLGRDTLPENIAVPLAKLADKLGVKPFLEYTHYALTNWTMKDPNEGLIPENLQLIRKFEGSTDEFWFVAIHIFMLKESGKLVEYTYDILRAVEARDRKAFDKALANQLENSKKINLSMNRMWEGSDPKKYNTFRTFIMGIKNQPMFPNGVVYKGVSAEPKSFRGESGANDSIVPTLDNLFEVTANLPVNPLTDILKDFRTYRPKTHQEFVAFVENKARQLGVKKFAMEDPNSTVLYLANLDQIAEFRERHWRFTKEYIIKHSKHPVATGGSPITTWLPNQLGVVLGLIEDVGKGLKVDKLSSENKKLQEDLVRRASAMRRVLIREVEELKKRFPGQDL